MPRITLQGMAGFSLMNFLMCLKMKNRLCFRADDINNAKFDYYKFRRNSQ